MYYMHCQMVVYFPIIHRLLNCRWTDIFILAWPAWGKAFNPFNAKQTHSIFVKLFRHAKGKSMVNFYIVKFIYSEKAKIFCKIFTSLLSYVVPVKSKVKISQNYVAFSKYMNFKCPSTLIWPICISMMNKSTKNGAVLETGPIIYIDWFELYR